MDLKQLKSTPVGDLVIPSFFGSLYQYQKSGALALYFIKRILLGDETGIGKTVQSIAALSLLRDKNQLPKNSTLVVVPNSMRYEWKGMFNQFCGLHTIVGSSEDKKLAYLKKPFDVLIIGYPTLLRRFDFFKDKSWTVCIFDEASIIKNSSTQTFDVCRQVADRSDRVILLNATTLENNLSELYSMCRIIDSTMLGTFDEFLAKYCEVEIRRIRTRYNSVIEQEQITGVKSLEALNDIKAKMQTFYFRRTYDEVGIQMPKEIIEPIYLDLKPEQKKAYLDELTLFNSGKIKGSTLLQNLLRICDGGRNWSKEDDPAKGSAKGEAIEDLIKSFGNEQFVIFSVFIDPLIACAKIAKKLGKRVGFFTGENAHSREKHKEEFKKGERDCLLVSKAAMRGINLENCRYLICVNKLFNPASLHQIYSRIKRVTSKYSSVIIYELITKDTVEENIVKLLDQKRALSDYINDDGEPSSNLTPEQISALLSKRSSLVDRDSLQESKAALLSP